MAKLKRLLPLVAILMVAAGVFAMNVNKNIDKSVKKDPVTYHYKLSSTALADVKNADNWEENSSPSCNSGTALPCTKVYDGGHIDT
ncbi:MAG: DUF6520 family protein [Niabella sp.]